MVPCKMYQKVHMIICSMQDACKTSHSCAEPNLVECFEHSFSDIVHSWGGLMKSRPSLQTFFFVNCGRPCVVNNLDWTILRHPTSSWIILLSVTWRNSSVIKKMAQKKRQRTLAAIGYGYGNPVHLLYNWIISSISIQPTRCQREHTCPDLRVGGSPSPQSGKEEVHHYWEINHQSSESCHQVQKPIKKTDQYKLRSCAEHGYLAQIGLPFIRQTSGHFLRWPTQANHLTLHTESPKQDPPHMSLFNPNPHLNFEHLFILGSYWSKTGHFPKSRIDRWFQFSMKNMIISNPCPKSRGKLFIIGPTRKCWLQLQQNVPFLGDQIKTRFFGRVIPNWFSLCLQFLVVCSQNPIMFISCKCEVLIQFIYISYPSECYLLGNPKYRSLKETSYVC